MKRRTALTVIAASLLFLGYTAPAAAQAAKGMVGSWTIVSVDSVDAAGNRTPIFGAKPLGQLIFTENGRYSLIFARSDMPKFASNDRDKGSPAENEAVVKGSAAHFGRYSVDEKEKSFTFHIEGGTFPNWFGSAQTRSISVSGDELRYTNMAASAGGGRADLVWKRVK